MDESFETDHPGVTVADPVADLFGQLRNGGRSLPWLADELIAVALKRSIVLIESIPTENYERVLYSLSHPPVWIDHPTTRVFRPLLAFFAGIGQRETGAKVNPYGDRFQLTRETPFGPVIVHVDFHNTPAMQRLQITRDPLPNS